MDEIQQLKEEVEKLKNRNKRVDLDKAWETSLARKLLVAIFTYIVIVLFFFVANFPKPFLSAVVPTVGFVLSTLSLPVYKNIWINRRKSQTK